MVCFFNDTATTEIYTLSLHDALPISQAPPIRGEAGHAPAAPMGHPEAGLGGHRPPVRMAPDRESTRLNSSHANISYAVFCLKKKMQQVLPSFSPSRLHAGLFCLSRRL